MQALSLTALASEARVEFAALAAICALVWLILTWRSIAQRSQLLADADLPDVTPYALLPTAAERLRTVSVWSRRQVSEITLAWRVQMSRMFALVAVLAAVAAHGGGPWAASHLMLAGMGIFVIVYLATAFAWRSHECARVERRAARLSEDILTPH